jgi:predicted ester cyclase
MNLFTYRSLRSLSRAALAAIALAGAAACSSEPPPPPPAPTPVAKTAQERVAFYQRCWDQFNAKAWDQFQTCYAENAVSEFVDAASPITTGRAAIIKRDQDEALSFPDRRGEVRLVLQHADHIASVAYYTATNTGALPPGPDGKPMPATNKPIGLLIAHTIQLDPLGSQAIREAAYLDESVIGSQLGLSPAPGPKPEKPTGAPAKVVTANSDATESANLTETRALFDAVNKHDLKALADMTPDNYKSYTASTPAGLGKKESMASTKELFSAFADVRITPTEMWAAGEYVVVTGTFEGTNTGDMPSMGLKKTGKKISSKFLEIFRFENGKCVEDWLFYNGNAWASLFAK